MIRMLLAALGLLVGFSLQVHAAPAAKLCVVGDWGNGSKESFAVAKAMHQFGCRDIIFAGDNFYSDGVASADDPQWQTKFETPYAELIKSGATFYVALGNHDYNGNPQAQIEYGRTHPKWVLPARYYKFKLGSACYTVIDTNDLDEKHVKWLRASLADRDCASQIVVGHHPLASSGSHGDAKPALRRVLEPALRGSDLYLSGHDHCYSDEGQYPTFYQVVVGTGGANLKARGCHSPQCKFVLGAHGFIHLETSRQKLKWTFYDTDLKQRHAGEKILAAKKRPRGAKRGSSQKR